ncbi:hypothetical protein M2352_003492 [Azospirillum fermentarium]|uniref:hypothetical protein n=1 Tax=Azospirillum fermentarium TaxID=1233114 RepID=UPI002226C3FA|nr:hypothetical protein [Azospirillum fermentarium]MCW2247858.1 hypothetical protein [Azospirillum fermentarium]
MKEKWHGYDVQTNKNTGAKYVVAQNGNMIPISIPEADGPPMNLRESIGDLFKKIRSSFARKKKTYRSPSM